jgi:pimeloyl-ACP methyl ester carboxylesterase
MGHSLGAATALATAPSASISALVLCGTPTAVLDDSGYVLPESLPLLVVHGIDDRLTPAEPVREWTSGQLTRGANVRWIGYPGAGHDLLHEPAHPAVTADIADWLTSAQPPA